MIDAILVTVFIGSLVSIAIGARVLRKRRAASITIIHNSGTTPLKVKIK